MTLFGERLRQERQDRSLRLGDLAKKLKISAPYLSQIETGQRFVPDGFEDKVIKVLELNQHDTNELHRAAAMSRSQYHISLADGATPDDRTLAAELSTAFARLSPSEKDQLRDLLKGGSR